MNKTLQPIDELVVARSAGETRMQLLFLELLPKHNYNIRATAIEAGYSEKTADKQGKRILRTALRKSMEIQAKDLKNGTSELIPSSSKEIVSALQNPDSVLSIVGYSSADVIKHYKYVVEQEKDMNAKLKALAPLLRYLGVELQADEGNKTIVPILNIGIREKKD